MFYHRMDVDCASRAIDAAVQENVSAPLAGRHFEQRPQSITVQPATQRDSLDNAVMNVSQIRPHNTSRRPAFSPLVAAVALATALAPPLVRSQATPPDEAASSPASAASERTSPERRAIPFTPENIARAFGFLDRDRNGSISREEGATIRGVARNFDRADINKDNALSRTEFDNAMNRAKSR